MRDMRAHGIDMLTIGQYLAPSHLAPAGAPLRAPGHLQDVRGQGLEMGFSHAAVGAMVRSSYHADQQAHAAGVVLPPMACWRMSSRPMLKLLA
jgi:lipoic acid synthetase